jgi:V8-like Glu-specific endopeptidase
MRTSSLTALWLALALSSGCTIDGEDVGASQAQVVGGTATTAYPAVAFLYSEFSDTDAAQLCSGTLITPRVILTAAHCVEFPGGAPERYLAYFGSTVLEETDPVGTEPVDITRYEYHPTWNIDDLEGGHDIGLVLLSRPVQGIAPMRINRKPVDELVGQDVHLVGWGRTTGEGEDFGVKREATSRLSSANDLLIEYGSATANTCQGDSGGPNFMTIDGEEVIAGITSYGSVGCDQYGVGTRVDHFAASYIEPFVAENDPGGLLPEDTSGGGQGSDEAPAGAPQSQVPDEVSGGCNATGDGGALAGGLALLLVVVALRTAHRRVSPARRTRRVR